LKWKIKKDNMFESSNIEYNRCSIINNKNNTTVNGLKILQNTNNIYILMVKNFNHGITIII